MTDVDEIPRFNAEFKADAQERYARMRARGPIHPIRLVRGIDSWVVVDYELARTALTHPALRQNSAPAQDALEEAGSTLHHPETSLGVNMLTTDPPDHTRLRRLVASAFTRRRMERLRPRVAEIAESLVDAFAGPGVTGPGEVDLVEVFTGPLPITVISELLGIPEASRPAFRAWTTQSMSSIGDRQREGFRHLNAFLAELIADKRRSPGDDLLSALIGMHDQEDGRLSEAELLGTANLLVVAGHDTTVNLMGNALIALFEHPDQLRRLREAPDLMPTAVEEFLRYDPSVEQTTMRYAVEDLELGGTAIPRGGIVVVSLTSAARSDPALSEAERNTLDVERANARHLSFGHGIHYCLGAPLARIEAEIGLNTLLRRLPGLRPAVGRDELDWVPSGIMRGPIALPVRFDR